jgi:pimeloyl-ACP methyl ester carboxylesterase
MSIIKTPSFELAIYAKGDPNSPQLALVIPGRLDTKDYAHNTSLVDLLSTKGYYALSFDPPGSWESPGSLELCTTTNYLKAVNELIEQFGNKPTLLLGHSRGGATAMLASPNPAVTGVVAIMASFGAPSPAPEEALRTGIDVHYRDLPPGTSKTAEKKKFAMPLNYFKDGQQYNPLATLQMFTKPKLLIYGDQDIFNTPAKVKEAYDLIPDPKMIHGVKSEHDYRLHPEVVEEINNTISEFLDEFYG